MLIQILGPGCKRCMTLADNARTAAGAVGLTAEVVKVTDMAQVAAAGVMSTPGLVIDGVLKSQGKLLTADEIAALL